MAEPKPIGVALYARTSTINHGQDVTMQTRELKEYIERRGWRLAGDYVDSGFSLQMASRVPGWGVRAAALTLSQYSHLEGIPKDWREWHPSIRKARLLSESLFNSWSEALLFRTLATLRLDVPVQHARCPAKPNDRHIVPMRLTNTPLWLYFRSVRSSEKSVKL
jgi:hypothetical protein